MKWKDKYLVWRIVELLGQAILILSKNLSMFFFHIFKGMYFMFVVFHKNDS